MWSVVTSPTNTSFIFLYYKIQGYAHAKTTLKVIHVISVKLVILKSEWYSGISALAFSGIQSDSFAAIIIL